MIERKARRFAYMGALLIVSLILLCGMSNFVYPDDRMHRKAFFCLLGLLFIYARAVPRKLWIPE